MHGQGLSMAMSGMAGQRWPGRGARLLLIFIQKVPQEVLVVPPGIECAVAVPLAIRAPRLLPPLPLRLLDTRYEVLPLNVRRLRPPLRSGVGVLSRVASTGLDALAGRAPRSLLWAASVGAASGHRLRRAARSLRGRAWLRRVASVRLVGLVGRSTRSLQGHAGLVPWQGAQELDDNVPGDHGRARAALA